MANRARVGWWLLLALAGCGEPAPPPPPDTPGTRLEAAAVAAGLVADPARASLAGSWARDSDRMCVVGPEGGEQRVGIVLDYGEGQGCSGTGTLRRSGDQLRVRLGHDCRFDAGFDGERVAFPAEVPSGCEALCDGRASLAAFQVERLSDSASEAAMLRGRDGGQLCGDS